MIAIQSPSPGGFVDMPPLRIILTAINEKAD